jgi:multiple sugar transport system substrate-binding protein
MPASPASAEFQTAYQNAVNEVLEGADPASALATAQEEAQSAIDDAAP